MANSLLAHLYSHIRGSQEDVATIALQYLLSQSLYLNKAFTHYVTTSMGFQLNEELQYECQSVGKNRERPDMSAIDNTGKEIMLFEMKFYASLTSNQPLTYLDRLKDEKGKGLMFICPANRIISLWSKLKDNCAERDYTEINEYCIDVENIRLAVITWAEVIEVLNKAAASCDIEYLADIKQLEGYCLQIDSDAFIPFNEEDLSALSAKKEERYYEVVDKIIDLIKADKKFQTSQKGLRAAPYRKGYAQYLYIDKYAIGVCYNRDMWKKNSSLETPFWLSIRDAKWNFNDEIKSVYYRISVIKREEPYWIALEALCDATLIEVCENLKEQVLKYIDLFNAEA